MPEGWEWTRIFPLTSDLPYGTAKKSTSIGKVAVLRMGNIQNGEIDYSDLVFSSDENDIEKYKLLTGDLLFNRTNSAEWVGKTAIYRGNIPAIYAGYLIRLRTSLCAEYLNAVMNSVYAKDYCNKVRTDGVNQSNINAQKLGHFVIPVPPQDEQERIALRIQQLLPIILNIQNERNDIVELIQKTKTKILDLAICGQLVAQDQNDEPASVLLERIRVKKEELIKAGRIKRDKKESFIFKGEDNSYYEIVDGEALCIDEDIPFSLPNNWEWVRLADTVQVLNGDRGKNYPAKNKLQKFGFPFVSASDIVSGKVSSENLLCMTETQYHALGAGKLLTGDIVYCIRGSLGKCGFFEMKKGAIASSLVIVRPFIVEKYVAQYIFNFLNSNLAKQEIKKYDNGSAQPNLAAKDFMRFFIPLPPLEELKRIVLQLEMVFKHLDSIFGILS